MPRFIDANELDSKLDALAKKYAGQGRFEAAKDYSFVQTVLLSAPTVDAVEVSRLGKLGRLMMPYKGCPRGRMGARGVHGGKEIQTEFEAMALDAIEDIEGDRWVPVLAEDLNDLKARLNNAVEVVRCKDCKYCIDTSASSTNIACSKGVNWRAVEPKHFCSYGERREGE